MEVILLEKVHNLGELGDKVRVKPGYGRNFLIPNRKAIPATPENIKAIEAQRADLEKAQAEAHAAALERAESLRGRRVVVEVLAGSEGKLFGSVGTQEIADALTADGAPVEKKEVRLPEGPLREVGLYTINLLVHDDVECDVEVAVIPEGGSVEDVLKRAAAPADEEEAEEADAAAESEEAGAPAADAGSDTDTD